MLLYICLNPQNIHHQEWTLRYLAQNVQVQTDQRCGRHRATTGYQPQQGVAITIQDAYSRREADKLDFL